jgi:hypothetical protein
MVRECVHR